MKKILSIALILCLVLTVVGCEIPFQDALPGSALPETTATPVPTEAPTPIVTEVPKDPNVDILTKETWVSTMDTNSTLTFYEDGSGVGTCKDEKRAFTDVQFTASWISLADKKIQVTYFYYIEHVTEYDIVQEDGIWYLKNDRSPRAYIYESNLPAYLEAHPEVEYQRDHTDF